MKNNADERLDELLRAELPADAESEGRVLSGLHRALLNERASQERQQFWSKTLAAGVALLVGGGLLALLVATNPSRGARLQQAQSGAEKQSGQPDATSTLGGDEKDAREAAADLAALSEGMRREIDALIAQLGSEEFDVRESALHKLIGYGPRIEGYLHQKLGALKDGGDPEVHSLLQQAWQRLKRERRDGSFKRALDDLAGADTAKRLPAARELLHKFEPLLKREPAWFLNKLAAQLGGTDPAAQTSAAEVIGNAVLAVKRVQKPLGGTFEQLFSDDDAVRAKAATIFVSLLEHAAGSEAVTRLLQALKHTGPEQAAAQEDLKAMGATAAPHLAEALADDDKELRAAAAACLKALGPAARSAAEELATQLDIGGRETRALAAETLLNLGAAGVDAASPLVDLLEHDELEVRKIAVAVLKKMGPAAAEVATDLAYLIDGDDEQTRKFAAEILSGMGVAAAEAVPDLVDILNDGDTASRELAGGVLLKIGPGAAESIPALAAILNDNTHDADARIWAAKVLGAIGQQDALTALNMHRHDTDPEVKAAVGAALQKADSGKQ